MLEIIWRMDGEQAETVLDKRISLPEPDIENITVLTKSLPNEPILPWHHFDSPWLEREEVATEEEPEAALKEETVDSEQLTLELELKLPAVEQPSAPSETPFVAPASDPETEAESTGGKG
ncbi:MAG TPA: hypothetical protein V6D29_14100 [Leptolyngbyaceae cyanobacterium]